MVLTGVRMQAGDSVWVQSDSAGACNLVRVCLLLCAVLGLLLSRFDTSDRDNE